MKRRIQYIELGSMVHMSKVKRNEDVREQKSIRRKEYISAIILLQLYTLRGQFFDCKSCSILRHGTFNVLIYCSICFPLLYYILTHHFSKALSLDFSINPLVTCVCVSHLPCLALLRLIFGRFFHSSPHLTCSLAFKTFLLSVYPHWCDKACLELWQIGHIIHIMEA